MQPRSAQLRFLLVASFVAICFPLITAFNPPDTGNPNKQLNKPKIYHSPPRVVWPSKGDSPPETDSKCGDGRVPHPDTGKCLPRVIYHEKCMHTIQCVTKRAICSGTGRKHATCRCPKYWTASENRIVCIRRSECTSGPELPGCLASNQICEEKSNRCRCNSGFTLDEWGHCYLNGLKPQIDPSDDEDEAQLVTITIQVNFTTQIDNLTQESISNVWNVTNLLLSAYNDDHNSTSDFAKDSFALNVAIVMLLFFLVVFLVTIAFFLLKNGACHLVFQQTDALMMKFHYGKVATGDPRETAQEEEATNFINQSVKGDPFFY